MNEILFWIAVGGSITVIAIWARNRKRVGVELDHLA
jgi:hypothetical protein